MSRYDRKKEKRLKHLLEQHRKTKPGGEVKQEEKKDSRGFLRRTYEDKYKFLLIGTFIVLLLAIGQIAVQTMMTGDFIHKDVSLKGGITIGIPVDKEIDPVELQDYLSSQFKGVSIDVRSIKEYSGKTTGVLIDSDINQEQWNAFQETIEKKIGISKEDFSVEEMGGSLGSRFFKQTIIALVIAFICMSIVVFIYFKSAGPSMIVILCAFADIIETVAAINILGIKVSTGGIAALLMLVGYSVDTDMLLSTRVIKRKNEGTVMQNTYSAVKTGLTMTLTTVAAVTVGIIFSVSPVIKQIMTILLIGLIFDIFNTWIQNVGLLRWYVEERGKKHVKN
ncbi:protein translocase subunit SecF [Candidatus Woesearchaeota archaeon]|nr:protein translocase subunit SecF [Candidatus Woesearchaeota archaeon]